MKRLSDYMAPSTKHRPDWLSILEGLIDYSMDFPINYLQMKEVCPEQIVMKGKWLRGCGARRLLVKPSKEPHHAFYFCPPEYLKSGEWTCASAVYTIFAIVYKYVTGDYPYFGQIPDGILASPEALKQYVIDHQKGHLDLTRIPPIWRGLFFMCLRQNTECRYQSLDDFEDEYIHNSEDYLMNNDWYDGSKAQNPFPGTVRLSDILNQIDGSIYYDLGFILFGTISTAIQKRRINLDTLVGICPQHIYLNADWTKEGIKEIHIAEDKYPHVFYAYYTPQFLKTGQWDSSDAVFALASILYRIYTCILPYIDNPHDDLDELEFNLPLENVAGKRKYPLYLDCIPEALHPFFQKALALKKKDRYRSLKAAADDFFRLPFVGTLYIKSNDTPFFELELMQQEYLNRPK